MHFFTPKAIQNLCQQYGMKPSKDYGQNYLLSLEPIEAMVAAADIKPTDTVVEVGPGFGTLTFALAEQAKEVVAFEIEKKIEKYWREKTEEYKNIEIIWGNVLYQKDFDLFCHSRENGNPEVVEKVATGSPIGPAPYCDTGSGMTNVERPYKVVANIPYQITSSIIKFFLEDIANKPESLTLMVQKEVASRICAKPGDMSVLAVAVQYYAEPEIIMPVPRHFFYPIPKVDSAVIKITVKPICHSRAPEQSDKCPWGESGNPVATDETLDPRFHGDDKYTKQFFKLVKTGFSSRRKILIKNLLPLVGGNSGLSQLETIWQKLGWLRTIRAQELSVEDWKKLVGILF